MRKNVNKQRMNNTNSLFKVLLALVFALVLLGSCSTSKAIIIDSSSLSSMENHYISQLHDDEALLRGNTASNMRNGGYLLTNGKEIWFQSDMQFDDGSTAHYLQHLLFSTLGSLKAENEIVASFNGVMIGLWHDKLLYLNKDDESRLYSLDTESYEATQLFTIPLSRAHLLGDVIYASSSGGDLYQLTFSEEGVEPVTLSLNSGRLIGVSKGMAYMLGTTEGSSIIRKIDVQGQRVAEKIVGPVYKDVQVSGQWFYYKEGTALMRRSLVGGEPSVAIHRSVDEYAVCNTCLVVSAPEGGIYISRLDGTYAEQVSADKASGLQLFGSDLFYKNEYDEKNIYHIDLEEGVRSTLLGFSLTDGGQQFFPYSEKESERLEQQFGSFARANAAKYVLSPYYMGPKKSSVLFVEINEQGNFTFYHHKDEASSTDDIDAVVLITIEAVALGQYTDGGIAYRQDWVLSLFATDQGTPLTTVKVTGRPPSEIKTGEGDRYGLLAPWYQGALELLKQSTF